MNKISEWLSKHVLGITITILMSVCVYTIYNLVEISRKPPVLETIKDGVQNHIIWNIQGECYFVRPYAGQTVYLIRVQDCDRK